MNYKINFNESIPDMIERLKQEHVGFETNFRQNNKI